MVQAIDLFCGAGGMSLGFTHAGIDVLCGVDYGDEQIETYRENFNHDAYQVDLASVTPATFAEKYAVTRDAVDVVAGGPPCQGFSTANIYRDMEDERNKLVPAFISYVDYFSPTYFVMENVVGIKSIADGTFVEKLQQEFVDLGYNVAMWTLNAYEYGVPQERERVFIVGSRIGDPQQPPTSSKRRHVFDAIHNLPEITNGETSSVPNHSASTHQKKTVEKIKATDNGETVYESYNQNQRLYWDRPAPTIVGSGWKYAHPQYNRSLTNRERAAIQGFPHSFEFHGNMSETQQMIGNAVPPRLAKAVIESLVV